MYVGTGVEPLLGGGAAVATAIPVADQQYHAEPVMAAVDDGSTVEGQYQGLALPVAVIVRPPVRGRDLVGARRTVHLLEQDQRAKVLFIVGVLIPFLGWCVGRVGNVNIVNAESLALVLCT
jgi:hypothetical protein